MRLLLSRLAAFHHHHTPCLAYLPLPASPVSPVQHPSHSPPLHLPYWVVLPHSPPALVAILYSTISRRHPSHNLSKKVIIYQSSYQTSSLTPTRFTPVSHVARSRTGRTQPLPDQLKHSNTAITVWPFTQPAFPFLFLLYRPSVTAPPFFTLTVG